MQCCLPYVQAATKISAEYDVPYLAHATMEPLNCTVDLRPDGCDIWTGTRSAEIEVTLTMWPSPRSGLLVERVVRRISFEE